MSEDPFSKDWNGDITWDGERPKKTYVSGAELCECREMPCEHQLDHKPLPSLIVGMNEAQDSFTREMFRVEVFSHVLSVEISRLYNSSTYEVKQEAREIWKKSSYDKADLDVYHYLCRFGPGDHMSLSEIRQEAAELLPDWRLVEPIEE